MVQKSPTPSTFASASSASASSTTSSSFSTTEPTSTSPVNTSASDSPRRGVRILALDGGGIRGLISLEILSYVSQHLYNDPSGRKLFEQFDLIAGTSTGGIITLGLSQGFSLEDAKNFYLELGKKLFGGTNILDRGARLLRFGFTKAYYSADYLQSLLETYLGRVPLTRIPKHAFVVSTNACYEQWKPYLWRTYELPKYKKESKKDRSASEGSSKTTMPPFQSGIRGSCNGDNIEALRATSAAPTYFKPLYLGEQCFVDGGVVANNPAELAVFEAKTLWPDRPIELILSIGTGKPPKKQGSENLIPLLNEIIDVATNADLIHRRLKNWIEMSLHRSDNYRLVRFNPRGLGDIPLDESNTTVLKNMLVDTLKFLEDPRMQGRIGILGNVLGVVQPSPPSGEEIDADAARRVEEKPIPLSSSSVLPLPLGAYQVQEEFEEEQRRGLSSSSLSASDICPLALSSSLSLRKSGPSIGIPLADSKDELIQDFLQVKASPMVPLARARDSAGSSSSSTAITTSSSR